LSQFKKTISIGGIYLFPSFIVAFSYPLGSIVLLIHARSFGLQSPLLQEQDRQGTGSTRNRIDENLMDHGEKLAETWNEVLRIRKRLGRRIAYDLSRIRLYVRGGHAQ
jgi:hypothetical protein